QYLHPISSRQVLSALATQNQSGTFSSLFSIILAGKNSTFYSYPYTSNLGNNVSYSCLLCSYCSGNFNAVPSDATSSSTSNPSSVVNSNVFLIKFFIFIWMLSFYSSGLPFIQFIDSLHIFSTYFKIK